MQLGTLEFVPVSARLDLTAAATARAIERNGLLEKIFVTEINPDISDTAAFCAAYAIGMETSANCVVLEAKRAEKTWYAACVVLATDRADINGIIRRRLDARKISFAPIDIATKLTTMEYGGITPLGLPDIWPILIDERVVRLSNAIIGSGIRRSKLLLPGDCFIKLPGAEILDIARHAS